MLRATQSEITHRGPVFSVERLDFEDSSGCQVRRDIVRHPGAVTIVPLLPDGRLVMIRNFRVAVAQPLIEFPAGKLEPGEDPHRAANRELEEETGYRAGQVQAIGQFFTSPGFADERMHAFLATNLTHVGQRLEPGEMIDVLVMPVDEALAMIHDGRIRDGKTLASLLLWLGLCRPELGGCRP